MNIPSIYLTHKGGSSLRAFPSRCCTDVACRVSLSASMQGDTGVCRYDARVSSSRGLGARVALFVRRLARHCRLDPQSTVPQRYRTIKNFLQVQKTVWMTIALALLLFSCGKHIESEAHNECRDELFYYYGGEKIFLTDHFPLRYDCLLVGFKPDVQNAEIVSFIKNAELFRPVEANKIFRPENRNFRSENDDGYNYLYVFTKRQKTCCQLKEIIINLEMVDIVSFAHNAFCYSFRHCDDLRDLISFSYYFYVCVKDENDLADLYAVAQETNTKIIRQDTFMPNWYTLSADKYSKGNALQMANYFYETGRFRASEPDLMGTFRIGI